MVYQMDEEIIEKFRRKLIYEEKSMATIGKYMHDVRCFFDFACNQQEITKSIVVKYKHFLIEKYAPSSVNSMLAALNCFFKEMGWYDCVVKSLKIQKESFRSSEREMTKQEYERLLDVARKKKNQRLYYVMQTLCSTGIRVSELRFVTVESLEVRRAKVSLKGKVRTVILPKALCRQLKRYVREKHIQSGPVFVTRSGRPIDRSNVYHEMKKLSEESKVEKTKIFPHNLRHLFACVFYQKIKNLPQLADILGHSNMNTTRIYTKISCEMQMRQIDMLQLVI